MTKNEIAAALAARGVTVKASQTKRELAALLEGLEALSPSPEPGGLMAALAADNELDADEPNVLVEAEPGIELPDNEPDPAPLLPEPHPDTDLSAPAPVKAMQRYELTIGTRALRGVTVEPEAVQAEANEIRGAKVVFYPAACPGDRVCLSWHGSRPGKVEAVVGDMAEVLVDGGATEQRVTVPLSDCCVVPND